jgi:hypothetical protein
MMEMEKKTEEKQQEISRFQAHVQTTVSPTDAFIIENSMQEKQVTEYFTTPTCRSKYISSVPCHVKT